MKTKLVNLTANNIIIGNRVIEPSGIIARFTSPLTKVGEADGVPLLISSSRNIANLPPEQDDTIYIVPGYIRTAVPARQDLASPAKVIRDLNGVAISCGALEINP